MRMMSRVRRTALAVATLALPATLLPMSAAEATNPAISFSYVDLSNALARPLFSADATGANPTLLTPAGWVVRSYSVTADGQTELLGLCHGSVSDCNSASPNVYGYKNVTWGLVLVHGTGSDIKARLLSSSWEVAPALTAAGDPVFMTNGTVYMLDMNNFAAADWATTVTAAHVHSSTAFAPPTSVNGWSTTALAVSADGSEVAVEQSDSVNARVVAGGFATGATGTYFEQDFTVATEWPTGNPLAVLDTGAVAFTTQKASDTVPLFTASGQDVYPTYGYLGTPAASNVSSPAAVATNLNNLYDLRKAGSTWYAWKDHSDLGPTPVLVSAYGTLNDPAIDTWTQTAARSNGDSSYSYFPTTATPIVFSPSTIANAAAGVVVFKTNVTSVAYGKRPAYLAEDVYGQDPTQVSTPTFDLGTQVGTLYYSINKGVSWRSMPTPGSHVVVNDPVYGSLPYDGVTLPLVRNTWFRWAHAADSLTAAAHTPAAPIEVTVVPAYAKFAVARSGSSRIVYGTLTRIGGKAVLYRKVKTKWVALGIVAITSQGLFNFGKRYLAKGSYRVVALADTWWAASARAFTV